MLTVGVKIFPHAADAVIQPMSGLVRQADTATSNNKTSIADALDGLGNNTDSSNSTPGDAWTVGNSTTNNSNNTSSGVTTDQFNQLNSLVNSLQSQVNADNLNIAQLNVSLNQANNKNDELNTKLNNALANQTANNNSANSDLINQIKAKNDALYSQLNAMNQSYQSQGQQYANQIQALQQQLASVQSNQNDNNQNAASNSALTTQLAQELSSAQSALQQLAATVTANNTQAQNLFSQYQAQIDQANQNSTDAENTANQANAQTQVNAGNISANSQAASNAQQTANTASSAASSANVIANGASSAASNAATTASQASSQAQTNSTAIQNNANSIASLQQQINFNSGSNNAIISQIFQARSHVFNNNENLYDAIGMPDGYYTVNSTNNAPSNFSGSGMMSVYTVNGATYLVLTDNANNNTWKGSSTTSNPSMSWNGWNQVGNESDIASNTNLINNLQNQVNTLQNQMANTLTLRGNINGQDLNTVTQTGIYQITGGAVNMPNSDLFGTLTVTNDNGYIVTQQLNLQHDAAPNATETWVRLRISGGRWNGWIRNDGGTQQWDLTNNDSLLLPGNDNFPDGVYKVDGVSRDVPYNGGQRWGILVKRSAGVDVSLTYYDAWWNGIYVNYKTISGWQGWREATN